MRLPLLLLIAAVSAAVVGIAAGRWFRQVPAAPPAINVLSKAGSSHDGSDIRRSVGNEPTGLDNSRDQPGH
jgi:hypothetical protein